MAASPMARARLGLVGAGCALLMLGPLIADAQQSVSDLLGRPATAEGQPKSYIEALNLLGYGVVVTAGLDSQKNHSLGIFRSADDQGPFFRNTSTFDLPEAYASYLLPVGEGLTLKAGTVS